MFKKAALFFAAVFIAACGSSGGSSGDGSGSDTPPPLPGEIKPFTCGTGNGSRSAPYVICSADGLDNIRHNLSASYALGSDVDLSAHGIWTAIGTRQAPFTGTLNGAGHSILNMSADGYDQVGLFGFIKGSTISHLHIKTASVTANNYAGGITGYMENSLIAGCSFEGSLTGKNSIGGIAGRVRTSTIKASMTEGSITAAGEVGGIAGDIVSSEISDAYSLISVTGQNYLGGIAGRADSSIIARTYAAGSVEGSNSAGDCIGGISGKADGSEINRNLALITYLHGQRLVGRIVGEPLNSDTSENYALNMPVWGAQTGSEAGTTLSAADSVKIITYTQMGWQSGTMLASPWKMNEGSFPELYFK